MEKKYVLGLDLGISSVGWAVMVQEENDYYIDDFGVRLFDSSENPKDGRTHAQLRREFRSSRRLIRRRKQRINDLKKCFFNQINLLSEKEFNSYLSTHKITNNIEYDSSNKFNPFVLRVKSLQEKILPEELLLILINITKRRGYNDKFVNPEEAEQIGAKEKNDREKSLNESINLVKKYGTIAQAIISDQNFRNECNPKILGSIHNGKEKVTYTTKEGEIKTKEEIKYKNLFLRQQYEQELNAIIDKQVQFYPELKNWKDTVINKIILRQRDFEVGPGPYNGDKKNQWLDKQPKHRIYKSFLDSEGNCTFYEDEPRGYRCSLTFELFQFINQLSICFGPVISEEQLQEVASELFRSISQGIIPGKDLVKKIIKDRTELDDLFFKNSVVWKDKKFEFKFKYLKFLSKYFLQYFYTIDFNNLENHFFNKLGRIYHSNISYDRRKKALLEFFNENGIINFSEQEVINNFMNVEFVTSTSNLSFKYMQEVVINFLQNGITSGKYQDIFLKNKRSSVFSYVFNDEKLFKPIKDKDLVKNAVVFRAVNEARKVIKALHQRYNFFSIINVEVARELAKSFDERKKIKKRNDDNERTNGDISKELRKNNIKDSWENIKRYKLWKQQNSKCFYCTDHHIIDLQDFNSSSLLQVDHIIPQSIISDDSPDNLVLVCAKSNQQKMNRTPLQWLKNEEEQKKSFINFCKQLYSSKKIFNKKYDYLMTKEVNEELKNGFQARNLNDTRYICKYILGWLNAEMENQKQRGFLKEEVKIQSILGAVTSRFRRQWLINSPYGQDKKVRDITPFHHAVDAIILTQFISFSAINFASDYANIVNLKKRLNSHNSQFAISTEEFDNSCKQILKKWEIDKLDPRLNALERLKNLVVNDKVNNVIPSLVKNLSKFIDDHVPVILSLQTKKTDGKKEKVIKFERVLSPEQYKEKMELLGSNFSYPFISYKQKTKIMNNQITNSQVPVKHKKCYEVNSVGQKVLKDMYYKDENNNIWEVNNYYGLALKIKDNQVQDYQWVQNFKLTKDKINNLKKEYIILTPNTIFQYYDKTKKEKLIKVYRSCYDSLSLIGFLVGTSYVSKKSMNSEIFGFLNFSKSVRAIGNEFKIIKPTILGKISTK